MFGSFGQRFLAPSPEPSVTWDFVVGERLWWLKDCDLFGRLRAADMRRIERRAVVQEFRRGETIYAPLEPEPSALVVLSGQVKLTSRAPSGSKTCLAALAEGDVFGEWTLFDAYSADERAEARSDVRLLAIPGDDLLWLTEQQRDFVPYWSRPPASYEAAGV